jgi:hypothetical protein
MGRERLESLSHLPCTVYVEESPLCVRRHFGADTLDLAVILYIKTAGGQSTSVNAYILPISPGS